MGRESIDLGHGAALLRLKTAKIDPKSDTYSGGYNHAETEQQMEG